MTSKANRITSAIIGQLSVKVPFEKKPKMKQTNPIKAKKKVREKRKASRISILFNTNIRIVVTIMTTELRHALKSEYFEISKPKTIFNRRAMPPIINAVLFIFKSLNRWRTHGLDKWP